MNIDDKNRFTVKFENKKIDRFEFEKGLSLFDVGEGFKEPGFEHIGSWAAHIYQNPFTREIGIKIETSFPEILDRETGAPAGMTESLTIMSLEVAQQELKLRWRGKK